MKIGFLSKVDIEINEIQSHFAPEEVQIFRSKEELDAGIHDLEVLIAMNQGFKRFTVDADNLARAKNLRLVQHFGA
ncbi:MAG: hypothetical protein HOB79_06190, partial [Rhodospirillaceae bacterium]|nr:hypothetical protein [Rhodospirillaceae bacterium]